MIHFTNYKNSKFGTTFARKNFFLKNTTSGERLIISLPAYILVNNCASIARVVQVLDMTDKSIFWHILLVFLHIYIFFRTFAANLKIII